MLNPNLIKKKSTELDIPFDNLLLGCLLEEFVVFISENNLEDLWLINDKTLNIDSYKRGMKDTLILAYSGSEEIDVYLRKLSLSIVSHFMNLGVKVTTNFLSNNRVCFEINLLKMKIPIILFLQEAGEVQTFPREKELELSLQNGKTVTYLEYPLEERISELCFDILDKLELLNEMEKYIDLYDILQNEAIEGRKVKDCLSDKCVSKKGFDLNRFEKLKSYKNYTYMKKKWKRVVRHTKRSDLIWEDVHTLIIRFLEPIYKAYVEDTVFFGDWMPDILRFLD